MSETTEVRYRHDTGGWWAETDALPTFTAAGSTFAEVEQRVATALSELLGRPVRTVPKGAFYEDDEPIEDLESAFDSGKPVVTAPPA